ncbi:cobyric acid synthase [Thiospirochaeta perfilievii]|uniref:Cobyric acid synthase n=1 Tax=Thiospirochaeta perfilievii TaxID=252967 RepID=A0A5C1Q7Q2_9SPIO|nr:cobyric acid synthase [Thiospirochaeta perfilievii]QEN04103.1 cobyric acid synthase [Thiospirochaeta perfilievii]
MGKSLMIMGTASSVGKSVITTGLCRLFYNKGINVYPFKSQNMALNSYITSDGKEMGRAQVVQAEAAGKIPSVKMNPILIKPSSDTESQIIVMGKILENMNASNYHNYKPRLKEIVSECYFELENESDLVIIEGAGSPAEINLREGDLVNMGMAEISNSPVILVGDIDKGGVFASLYGTIKLLSPNEQKRIKGVIINKFRGDIKLLEPGLKMLEELIDIPVLGVIPWNDIDIEDEDSLTNRFNNRQSGGVVELTVLKYPHISNYTDFTYLESLEDVNVRYVSKGDPIGYTDVIVIPGSKSVVTDFNFLKSCGWDREIYKHNKEGRLIIGICGGFQMLGKRIEDPHCVEGDIKSSNGLGLLDMVTSFETEKRTIQNSGVITEIDGEFSSLSGISVQGYEIHMGSTISNENYFLKDQSGFYDGAVKGNVIGTYFHGIFDSSEFTSTLISKIKRDKGLDIDTNIIDYKTYKDLEFNKLAELYKQNLDMDKIKRIIEDWA